MADAVIDALLKAVPLPALFVNEDRRIAVANPDACALLGQQILGRHFATMLRQPQVVEAIETCLEGREPQLARHSSNDGVNDAAFEVSCQHVDGVGGVLVVFRDVTDVEAADQMRRDFVANVSHELRTPLTALMGFIETLRGPAREDAEARHRFLGTMETEAARMNRLIDDLLSLSRVEAEERVQPDTEVDLVDGLKSTLMRLQPLADEAGMTLKLIASETSVFVLGDDDQLQQVFTNLIENAVKYGQTDKSVEVKVATIPRDPVLRGPAVAVEVIDHGPGIDLVHLPRLTERFYRGDAHRSRALGGTGLGLAIVKHIVKRHRGRLRVQSEPGQGSVFTVTLPR